MSRHAKSLITIIGTTGVGKSQLSVELAKALNGEVINGDSMQMYQGLDNITNKHPVPERENIPHHLLGHVSWKDEYGVTQFEREAISIIDDIHSRGKVPILVGGTHYYTQSILFKNSTIASSETLSKRQLTTEQERILDDPVSVLEHLKKADPVVAQKFHPNDTRRLRRCLEIYFTTDKRPSEIYEEQQSSTGDESLELRYRSLVLWIWSDQKALDPRLDARVDQMVKNGLYNEVDEMFREYQRLDGPDMEGGVWQVIGFRQFLPWLQGQVATADGGIEDMKTVTRKYAKRQTKWILKKLLFMMNQVAGMGDVALLNATDLSQWSTHVRQRGVSIAADFLAHRPYREPLAPPGLENMLKVRTHDESFHVDKWVQHTCDSCKDADGNFLVFVGDHQWNEHIRGRRHRASIRRKQKIEHLEQRRAKGLSVDEDEKEGVHYIRG